MTRRGTSLPSELMQRVSTLKRELWSCSSFMNFMTSACLEVAVKLLASATVKGFFCVEEKERVAERRNRVEDRRNRIRGRYIIMCFFCFFIKFSFLGQLVPSRLGSSQNEYKSLYEFNLPVNEKLWLPSFPRKRESRKVERGRFSFFIFNVNMKKKEFIRKRDHPHYKE